MEIRIEVDKKDVEQLLSKLQNANFSVPLRDAAVYMKSSVLKNFEVGGRPKWVPLSKKTLQEKLKKGYSPQPLIRTGRLRQSINVSVSSEVASVYPGVWYGAQHQFGTKIVPARPFLVFQPEDIDTVKEIFVRYIEQLTRGVGK